ncbi:MAG: hypothetical protein SFX18_13580 [Pirellulales bacterium]|nr:hypothetical protein [Pirellulales bacterium]
MISRRWLLRLIAGALAWPILLTVLFLVEQLLAALGDTTGAFWLRRCAIFGLAVWGANLVGLLVVTAIRQLRQSN